MSYGLDWLEGKRVLIVVSTGGHLAQSVKWAEKLRVHPSSLFVTFDSAQSRSLLAEKRHIFVPYVAPRDWLTTIRVAASLLARTTRDPYDAVLSTGAAVALSALPVSAVKRVPYFYIESVSRFFGPSVTGRFLERVPAVRLFAQHAGYSSSRWIRTESLLEDYAVSSQQKESTRNSLKIFVTLGTIRPYSFNRIIDTLLPALRPDDEIVWQLGETQRSDLPGDVHEHIGATEFNKLLRESDVVVTHAGVGTLMGVLDSGKVPLVMARRADLGEHVDDHQAQITLRLVELGLAREIGHSLSRDELWAASSLVVSATL